MMEKTSKKDNFLKGIWEENPLFVSVLGTCPALATTKTIESAIGMGFLFIIVLICSNVLISLLRKLIPEEIKTPAYIVIIASFVTVVKMFTNAYLPELYSTLGVFISLIVVNCIVLGRAESYASNHGVFDSFLDALGMGIGYMIALLSISLIREVIGTGAITFGRIFTFIPLTVLPILKGTGFDFSISIFTTPVGAFIVFGLILATIAFIENRKKEKVEVKARLLKAASQAKAQTGDEK